MPETENSKKKRGRPRKSDAESIRDAIEPTPLSELETTPRPRHGRPKNVEPPVRDFLGEALKKEQAAAELTTRAMRTPQKRPRATTKEQYSVRIDERLAETAKQRAQAQKLTFTDAVEEGLWLYLGEQRPEVTTQLRFLVSALSLPMQKRLLNYAAFLVSKELNPSEQRTRDYFGYTLDLFGQDPRAQKALGSLSQPEG